MDDMIGASKWSETTRTSLTLKARPERRLIRSTGSKRYVDFYVRVERDVIETERRQALKLALVLDRSGSMQGEKLQTAKQATLAVLEQLTARDQLAVVSFDDRIDIVQKLAPVTPALKREVQRALQAIQARANTALHEGWLMGCNAITGTDTRKGSKELARCFLLTDGIANVGETDPERIAGEAAGVREHTGISTSTFGIGTDYNELLLGPMAVAGGGQFHHLRRADEIMKTFVGELGDLLTVAARQVALELELPAGARAHLVSAYWEKTETGKATWRSIELGDLQSGEERHVVVRFDFPAQEEQEQCVVRARLVAFDEGGEQKTDWMDVRFAYASQGACDDEPGDPEVLHWVGLHEADYARREAIRHNNRGDLGAARATLGASARRIATYAQQDAALQEELKQLQGLEQQMAYAPIAPAAAKEAYSEQQRRSRNQKDYREGKTEGGKTEGEGTGGRKV